MSKKYVQHPSVQLSDDEFAIVLEQIRSTDYQAPTLLWNAYSVQLAKISQWQKDRCGYHGFRDNSDIANEVLFKFVRRYQTGHYQHVRNKPTFVACAFTLAKDIVCKFKEGEHDQSFCATDVDYGQELVNAFADRTSHFHDVEIADCLQWLLRHLEPDQLKIVELRLAGYSKAHIGELLDKTSYYVTRELNRIFEKWKNK